MTGTAAAWGWVAHLTDGGTTPWADWSGTAEPRGRRLPGAQQLELLRRLNLAGRPSQALAGAVLAADPSRRSRPELPLVGGGEERGFGPPPVDPGTLSEGELSRLAAVLIAQRLATRDVAEPTRRRPRPWRTRYLLLGDPELVVPLRRRLVEVGRPPGGWAATPYVLATDTGQALVDLWTAQSLHQGAPPWHEWLDTTVRQYRLPEAADPDALARRERDRTGRKAHVVTDPSLAPRLLGARRVSGDAPRLPAAGVDLGRRIATALRPVAPAPRRTRLLADVVRPWLATGGGAPLVLPDRHRDWVAAEAERVVGQVGRGRYPVHGDPALLLPSDRPGTATPEPDQVLALAVRLLLELTEEGS